MNDSKQRSEQTELGCSHITPAGGNVFLDLGFPSEEAEWLKAASRKATESRRPFAEELASMPNFGEDTDFARIQDK
jgi:hypothetical protein